MDVLRLITEDYELTVRAEGVDVSFRKASIRNINIEKSTEYNFAGGYPISFELPGCDNNEITSKFFYSNFATAVHPIFFENKDYYFDIVFNQQTEGEPIIYTYLEEIKKSFILRKVRNLYFLTGVVNYRNDIGKTDFELQYKKNGTLFSHKLSFEVFPVKLDYKSDYKNIIADINKEFSALVLDILKKTYINFKEGNEVTNDIIWWRIFRRLYKNILFSAKLILNKPHNRLIKDNYYAKADRIKLINSALEEQLAHNRQHSQKYYRVERKTLTTNTLENQFFKEMITNVNRKFAIIKNKLISLLTPNTSDEFLKELDQIEKEFSIIKQHPFFRQIDKFKGIKQESLVLQKAAGYSSLFRSWIILKKGIDFLDGVNKIELKNIADLYQIWCFIEMKNMIQRILNKAPEEVDLAEILIDSFTIQLRSGRNSKVSFKKENGDVVELFHELKYTSNLKDNTLTHTVNQEPDIVLRISKNDLTENHKFTYLFDAKYRLISDDKVDANDFPPDDAINQMHRYRDAIFYQENQFIGKPKKEVIGAYVLFPGSDKAEEVTNLYFQKSIEKVNIGAYPLIPGSKKYRNNSLLMDFLKNTLEEKESLNILIEDIIPHKGMRYEDPDSLVLAGFMASEGQKNYFSSGNAGTYHLPVYKKGGSLNTIRHLNKLKYFSPIINGIVEYYEIIEIKVIPRSEIFEKPHILFRDLSDSYYVFALSNRKLLNKKIESSVGGNRIFRYARFSELKSSLSINDFNKTSQENI